MRTYPLLHRQHVARGLCAESKSKEGKEIVTDVKRELNYTLGAKREPGYFLFSENHLLFTAVYLSKNA